VSASESAPREEATGADRRRTKRFSLVVPVEVEWTDADGTRVLDQGRARNVSIHGAFLLMTNYPRLHCEIALKNSLSGESARARVVAIRRSKDGKLQGVAVELLAPNETFWGVTFQLQRSTAQLLEVERALQSRDIDFRVLRELREAVEYLRKTASAVQQWQDLQVEGEDAYKVLPVLTVARVDRTTHLINELTADLEASEVTEVTAGFGGFVRAVERLRDRLSRISPRVKLRSD
jgi:hypothetical protein